MLGYFMPRSRTAGLKEYVLFTNFRLCLAGFLVTFYNIFLLHVVYVYCLRFVRICFVVK